jgi:hypothetical protein
MNLADAEYPVEQSCQHGSEKNVPSQFRNLSICFRNKLFIQDFI